jgi:Ca2+-binding RTX toxin-like protein
VDGTAGADTIRVYFYGADASRVAVVRQTGAVTESKIVPRAQVKSVTVNGGDGNDTLTATFDPDDADVYSGGNGRDTADYHARYKPLKLSLDGVANDGVTTGEQDNVKTDVENLTGGTEGDTLVGSATANVLDGGHGRDSIVGGAGNDTLIATGGDTLRGNAGDDMLVGGNVPGDTDVLDGGTGYDVATANYGDDQITQVEHVVFL